MKSVFKAKYQWLSPYQALYLFFLLFFFVAHSEAAQMAMVIVDRAIIYADQEMTSPLGYVSKGKKFKVGDIPRNKSQVYPIPVSGKIGFIRVIDVTTEKESMDSERLIAERFTKSAQKTYKTNYTLSYFRYNSQIKVNRTNLHIANDDTLSWNGFSFKGEALISRWSFQVLMNYLQTSIGSESYKVFETGFGGAFSFIDTHKFTAKLEAQGLFIPWSSYAIGSEFRNNSYGYTLGGGLNLNYFLNDNWGIEGFWGLYYMKLLGFDAPAPYADVQPSFIGTRIGIGINFRL